MSDLRFFLSSPHSGEEIASEASWLKDLPEEVLMCDVDRFVDQLYDSVAQDLGVLLIKARWHRYFSDANRLPGDVDQGAVLGVDAPEGKFPAGLIWQRTTQGDQLIHEPISQKTYQKILEDYYSDFHQQVQKKYSELFAEEANKNVYQIDLHSMPSVGETSGIHRDPGEIRKEIVVSDQEGKSADPEFVNLIKSSYSMAGFDVGYNWPYFGGRVTQTYGVPEKKQHCVQVELRRDLYMNEVTKQKSKDFEKIQAKLSKAMGLIYEGMKQLAK